MLTIDPILLQPPKRYCYFNSDSGKIIKFTNYIDTDSEEKFFEIQEEEISSLISGKDNLDSFEVEFNSVSKNWQLLRKGERLRFNFSVNDLIHEVVATETDASVILVQDIKNTCWKLLISSDAKIMILESKMTLTGTIEFSVTKQFDPNILYKTLKFDFSELVKQSYSILPFTSPFEFDGRAISVYTNKRFESYKYQRIAHE